MPKRTYQPSKIKRARKYGFRNKTSTKRGIVIIKKRRNKGRKKLTSA